MQYFEIGIVLVTRFFDFISGTNSNKDGSFHNLKGVFLQNISLDYGKILCYQTFSTHFEKVQIPG